MAKKKTQKSSSNVLLSLVASVLGLLTSLALFLNVWVWKVAGSSSESLTDVGGYFEDMSSYEKLFNVGKDKLPVWGSTLAGVCVIVALVTAVVLTIVTVLNMLKKSNKTLDLISKVACLVMVLAGLVALVGSLVFVLAEYEGVLATYSMTMAFGAIAGFMFPILGGTLGLLANRK